MMVIPTRSAEIGQNFSVRRILPFAKKRMIGPFCFLDHMGPIDLSQTMGGDVLSHPHIGLSTLTYLFEGKILHKDSLGTVQPIKAGDVNWMTAGHGIVHAERIPDEFRKTDPKLHGLQAWIALPQEQEDCSPDFQHYPNSIIPQIKQENCLISVIAGEYLNQKSPVQVSSPLVYLKVEALKDEELFFQFNDFEMGVYAVHGNIELNGEKYNQEQLLYFEVGKRIHLKLQKDSLIVLFGGEPFTEPRYMDWNFVSTSKEKLTRAIERWNLSQFPEVLGEKQKVPYPNKKI